MAGNRETPDRCIPRRLSRLGYGALNATERDHFRRPFMPQLGRFGSFLKFPRVAEEIPAVERSLLRACGRQAIGAVWLNRSNAGGIHVAPAWFPIDVAPSLQCHGIVLIFDEIYTGFGRTGAGLLRALARRAGSCLLGQGAHRRVSFVRVRGESGPFGSGLPQSTGEAIHTSTFLGHPLDAPWRWLKLAR